MSDDQKPAVCALCGEPMPPGEQMFEYHGYSGPCPKPPLQNPVTVNGPTMKAAISDMADALAKKDARIRELEAKVESMRKALEPFAKALNDSRLSYAKRYNEPLEHGFSIFDKMPDKWPMDGVRFNMGDLRRAAKEIETGNANQG